MKVGDLVALKSGGPVMTVNGQYDTGQFQCAWFVGEARLEGRFAEAALVAAKAEPARTTAREIPPS